jgi:aromatase
MGHTCNSIVINADYNKVFDMSNDIEKWQDYFDEYTKSEVVEKSDTKLVFNLTHKNGNSWQSYRLLFKDQKFTYASRVEPMFPFVYMKIIWLYRDVDGGTEMTWIQDFKMADGAKFNDEKFEELLNEHSANNLKRFKNIIETS